MQREPRSQYILSCPVSSIEAKAPIARYCYLSGNEVSGKRASFDSKHIRSSLSTSELSDELLLRNLIHGTLLNGKLWPLIFDTETIWDQPLGVRFRSIRFFRWFVSDPLLLDRLSDEEKPYFVVGVRDLWLADVYKVLRPESDEHQILIDVLNILDDTTEPIFPSSHVQNVPISICPTKHCNVMRFVENLGDFPSIGTLVDCAAQLLISSSPSSSSSAPPIIAYAVWVDPRDLSYHNFECILPMDRFFDPLLTSSLELIQFKQLHPHYHIFTAKLTGADCEVLKRLDSLELYQVPPNSASRGGLRFIFHSNSLSRHLTSAIRASGLLEELKHKQPGAKSKNEKISSSLDEEFVAVNSVFRLNRFAESEGSFASHTDSPYFDAAQGLVSRYTILIYLTSGERNPSVLSFCNASICVRYMNSMTVVIFHQQYEHVGRPYEEGAKVFLRSELIFKCDPKQMTRKPETGAVFSSAIYYTLQSAFDAEYARHAHELYERVNRLHWSNESASKSAIPLLYKRWNRAVHFATNGYDYYFPCVEKDESKLQLSLKVCALIAVTDHLNCRLGKKEDEGDDGPIPPEEINKVWRTFRKECESKRIDSVEYSSAHSILKYLWEAVAAAVRNKRSELPGKVSTISKKEKRDWYCSVLDTKKFESAPLDHCCDQHFSSDFIPWRCADVVDEYKGAIGYAERQLLCAPLLLLDTELRIDPSAILVQDDKIFINSANPTGEPINVHFAGCRMLSSACEYVTCAQKIPAPRLLLPPIIFRTIPAKEASHGLGFHFMLDFFRNDWEIPIARVKRVIPIPTYYQGGGRLDYTQYTDLVVNVISHRVDCSNAFHPLLDNKYGTGFDEQYEFPNLEN